MTDKLTVGVAQLAPEATLQENLDKILLFIEKAKAAGCRVVITPEGALYSSEDTPKSDIDAAVERIRRAAAANDIYVVVVAFYRLTDDTPQLHNRLIVIGPDGRDVHIYDKLWGDLRFPNAPGPFLVDGIPCCATICADRWLRSTEELPVFAGAQVIIECSGNYANEWIPEYGWYWYVPRALRNGVYCILCNQPTDRSRVGRWGPGHGHSCIIAPDGSFLAKSEGESDRLLVATLDMAQATRAEAIRRHSHPLFKRFWDAGITLMGREQVSVPSLEPFVSPEMPITLAAAQMACSRSIETNLASIERLLRLAKRRGADVVGFPELALTGTFESDIVAASKAMLDAAIQKVCALVRNSSIYAIVGAPYVMEEGKRFNSAFAIGPDGAILTRYDQLVVDRPHLFAPGQSTKAMWFSVMGVPTVLTIGRDALWNELAELAAVRGAQMHVHVCYDTDLSERGMLLRKQLWVCLASYKTFTATVNAATPIVADGASLAGSGHSMIWQDFFHGSAGPTGGYWPHCAEQLAIAGPSETVIHATQRVQARNVHCDWMTMRTNPQMRPWYAAGAHAIDDEMHG